MADKGFDWQAWGVTVTVPRPETAEDTVGWLRLLALSAQRGAIDADLRPVRVVEG